MQRQYQTVENRQVVDERSIVEADFYAKRFKEFVFERVFHPAEDDLSTHPISMNVFSSQGHDHPSGDYERVNSNQSHNPSSLPPVHRF
jgi:hypothetical protein